MMYGTAEKSDRDWWWYAQTCVDVVEYVEPIPLRALGTDRVRPFHPGLLVDGQNLVGSHQCL